MKIISPITVALIIAHLIVIGALIFVFDDIKEGHTLSIALGVILLAEAILVIREKYRGIDISITIGRIVKSMVVASMLLYLVGAAVYIAFPSSYVEAANHVFGDRQANPYRYRAVMTVVHSFAWAIGALTLILHWRLFESEQRIFKLGRAEDFSACPDFFHRKSVPPITDDNAAKEAHARELHDSLLKALRDAAQQAADLAALSLSGHLRPVGERLGTSAPEVYAAWILIAVRKPDCPPIKTRQGEFEGLIGFRVYEVIGSSTRGPERGYDDCLGKVLPPFDPSLNVDLVRLYAPGHEGIRELWTEFEKLRQSSSTRVRDAKLIKVRRRMLRMLSNELLRAGPETDAGKMLASRSSLAGFVFMKEAGLIADNVEHNPYACRLVRTNLQQEVKFKSLAATPIYADSSKVGVLMITSTRERAFPARNLHALSLAARGVGRILALIEQHGHDRTLSFKGFPRWGEPAADAREGLG